MINHRQLREFIIRPSLNFINLWSENDEELQIMICAQESLGGTYLKQIRGPALGIFQQEPKTYHSIWDDYLYGSLKKRQDEENIAIENRIPYKIANFLGKNYGVVPDESLLMRDLGFASIMCRVHFIRFKEPTPHKDDLKAMFKYYKKYYNTNLGDTTEKEFLDAYQVYLRGR